MYAILQHGGRQYRVAPGDRLLVDRLTAEVGSVVALTPVLLISGDDGVSVGESLGSARVSATVVAHRQGKKLRVFTYKPKKRHRRMLGYRSRLTELRVESVLAVEGAGATAAPRAQTEAAPSATRPRRARAEASGDAAEAPAATASPAAEASPSPAGGEQRPAPRRARPKARGAEPDETAES